MSAKAKGNAFEREMCRILSLWWTGGKADDCFWRTSNSGGRATVRDRKGKATSGHHGDVSATDGRGKPLLDLLTIELKRGYNSFSAMDILDKPDGGATQVWEEWISQATESAEGAGTLFWLIIAKKDRREVIVAVPNYFKMELRIHDLVDLLDPSGPSVCFKLPHTGFAVVLMRLKDFLTRVTPDDIKELTRLMEP